MDRIVLVTYPDRPVRLVAKADVVRVIDEAVARRHRKPALQLKDRLVAATEILGAREAPEAAIDQPRGGLVLRVAADVTHIREPRIKFAIQRYAALRVGVRAEERERGGGGGRNGESLFCFADMS